jgi:hypothetical protein
VADENIPQGENEFLGNEPECVRAPEEKDSLSAAKARAEELLRRLA